MSAPLLHVLGPAPVLGDGGTGSSLVSLGIHPDACFDELNLTQPRLVASVHREFAAAGSAFVETNTFGANRFALARFGLAHAVGEINRAGAAHARGAGVTVAGSIGPLRVRLAPYGTVRPAEAYAAYREQIEALAEGGVDVLWIETQSDIVEIEQALRAARDASDLPVVVTATFTRDDRTLLGSSPEQVARRLAELGADGIGANCSEGPAQVLRIVREMLQWTGDIPVIAKPNAGGPSRVGARVLWPATPEYVAGYARSLVAEGVAIVGGCCGTAAEHVAAIGRALREPVPQTVRPTRAANVVWEPAVHQEQAPPTVLAARIASGSFVVVVEMDPPRGFETARLLAGAETIAEAGADAINVAGSSRARMRMSPWAPCRLIQERVGIDTVLTFPTRGRNLLRIGGDLLAAHALGIRNLFVVLGDPAAIGDVPQAADPVDVVPTGLVALVTGAFNQGTDQAGEPMQATRFFVGCAVSFTPDDLDREVRVLRRKVRAGAGFALSPPVFSIEPVRELRRRYEARYGPLTLPLLVGVMPLVTARHAEFLHNEVPGIVIPDETRARLRAAGDRAAEEGLRTARELLDGLRGECAGVYVMPQFARMDLAAEIVESARRR